MKNKIWIGCTLFIGIICTPTLSSAAKELPSHIETELSGPSSSYVIDAEVISPKDTYLEGTLKGVNVEKDILGRLYGDQDGWGIDENMEESDFEQYWRYGETCVTASTSLGTVNFGYATMDQEECSEALLKAEETTAEELIKQLDLPLEARYSYTDTIEGDIVEGPRDYYTLYCILDGVRAAHCSPFTVKGTLAMVENKPLSLSFFFITEIDTSKETEILPMEDILEKLTAYVETGLVPTPYYEGTVDRIEMQYYVEEKNGQYCFFPVWVFEIPQKDGQGWSEPLCVDARTGDILVAREL